MKALEDVAEVAHRACSGDLAAVKTGGGCLEAVETVSACEGLCVKMVVICRGCFVVLEVLWSKDLAELFSTVS